MNNMILEDSQGISSPLNQDTQFVPHGYPYLVMEDVDGPGLSLSRIIPFNNEETTFNQISNSVFIEPLGKEKKDKKKIFISLKGNKIDLDASIKSYKKQKGVKQISGLKIKKSFQQNQIQMKKHQLAVGKYQKQETRQIIQICCWIIPNYQNPLLIKFCWQGEEHVYRTIVLQINKAYQSKLNIEDICLFKLFRKVNSEKSSNYVSFQFDLDDKIKNIKDFIFDQPDKLNFAAVVIKSDNFDNKESVIPSGLERINSQSAQMLKIITISADSKRRIPLNFDKIKKYPIKYLLDILQIPAPQRKGLKIMGQIHFPSANLQTVQMLFAQSDYVNYIQGNLVDQRQFFISQIYQQIPISTVQINNKIKLQKDIDYYQRKMLKQHFKERYYKTEPVVNISALLIYNSGSQLLDNKTEISSVYHEINTYINNYFTCQSKKEAKWKNKFIRAMYKQINSLNVYKGPVYRKLNYILKKQIGDIIEFKHFIIASKAESTIQEDRFFQQQSNPRTNIIIVSKQGRSIQLQTSFNDNKQVIFLPYSKFKVINIIKTSMVNTLSLQQVIQEEPVSVTTIILWLDKKKQELKKIKQIPLQTSTFFYQLKSNQQLKQWINEYRHFISMKQLQFIVITNMARKQGNDNKQIQDAGIETIRIVCKQILDVKIILFIGHVEYTIKCLEINQINPKSLNITNQLLKLHNILKKYCSFKQEEIIVNVQKKQAWKELLNI